MSNTVNNLNLGSESNNLNLGSESNYPPIISNATVEDTLLKSAGPKPLPVYLDLKQRLFLVDPKIAGIQPAVADSAEHLVDDLKFSIRGYLTDRQTAKRNANENILKKKRAKNAAASLELQRKEIKERQARELSEISSKQKAAQKNKSAASRLAGRSSAAVQSLSKPSFWQRMTGKRTVVGGKHRKTKRRSTRRA
jgi:hypothetical protein